MKVEYDRTVCNGWFQCVQEWNAFEMNINESKADLNGAEETTNETFIRDVPDDAEEAAKAAAESCPVDAIVIYDDKGRQLIP